VKNLIKLEGELTESGFKLITSGYEIYHVENKVIY
jgi:hypothetical protein